MAGGLEVGSGVGLDLGVGLGIVVGIGVAVVAAWISSNLRWTITSTVACKSGVGSRLAAGKGVGVSVGASVGIGAGGCVAQASPMMPEASSAITKGMVCM